MIGNGWKMLMECLAAGKGICLPATVKAASNTAAIGILIMLNIESNLECL